MSYFVFASCLFAKPYRHTFTETQRAVSYFEIPSRNTDPQYLENMGNVIPAGRGMKDVQVVGNFPILPNTAIRSLATLGK